MVEWVEVKGVSVEVAVKAALEELGIDDAAGAEVKVLQEPQRGFLGIGRQDAIVHVEPVRGKRRRSRKGSRGGRGKKGPSGRTGTGRGPSGPGQAGKAGKSGRTGQSPRRPAEPGRAGKPRKPGQAGQGKAPAGAVKAKAKTKQQGDGQSGKQGGGRPAGGGRKGDDDRAAEREVQEVVGDERATEALREEQAAVVKGFLTGLLDEFGLVGEVTTRFEGRILLADISGEQTEALIGPKASVMQAVHELTKTVVQRRTARNCRLRLDIAGYGERRRRALAIYAGRLAEQVLDEGAEIELEPMNAADRKVVHDAVSGVDGVRSFSEGPEPRRKVVLSPDG